MARNTAAEEQYKHVSQYRGNPTVDAQCKSNSCESETATVYKWVNGSYRAVGCDGCGREYQVAWDGTGPFEE